MKKEINFGGMAQSIMFGGTLLLAQYGVQYREGKTQHDVSVALRKAVKNGRGKVENELGMFEVYLRQLFKAA